MLAMILVAGISRYQLDEVLYDAASQFGGASAYQLRGSWLSPNGEVIVEDSWRIDIFIDKSMLPAIKAWAKHLAVKYRQQEVGLVVTAGDYEPVRP